MHFKIIVTGGPCEKYIADCLESIAKQTHKDWECICMLDPVDNAYEAAMKIKNKKIKVVKNYVRNYALKNIVTALDMSYAKDNDIIILIDGDDRLVVPNALETINMYYERNSNLMVTHGSYCYEDGKEGENCLPYHEWDFNHGIREVMYKFAQPKTFRFKLWKYIPKSYLRDKNKEYYKTAWDIALLALVELAGYDRVQYIPNHLYQYNKHDFNDCKINRNEQIKVEIECRGKIPLKRLEKI